MKKVAEYFTQYPGSNKCHQTSDGLIFHEEGDAHLHAKSLEDKTVSEYVRGSEKVTALLKGLKNVANAAANIGKAITGAGNDGGKIDPEEGAKVEKPAAPKAEKPKGSKGQKPAATKTEKPKNKKPEGPKVEEPGAGTPGEESGTGAPGEEPGNGTPGE